MVIPICTVRKHGNAGMVPNAPVARRPRKAKAVSPSAGSGGQKDRYTVKGKWRQIINNLLNDPSSSIAAKIITSFIMVLICASVLISTLATCKGYDHLRTEAWIESMFSIFFTIELVARCCVQYETFREVLGDVYFFVDFLGVAGFYLNLFGLKIDSDILSCFRVIRLFKLCRGFDGTVTLATAIHESLEALKVPIFFLFMAAITFGVLIFAIENMGKSLQDDTEPAFTSIPHSIWFMFVTMSTVGYGDVSPNTTLAKIATIVAMNFGVMFMAMPLAIVGNNFVRVWEDREIYKASEKMRAMMTNITPESVSVAFNKIDDDHSGYLSLEELANMLSHLGLTLQRKDMKKVWRALDSDGSGFISKDEFQDFVFPNGDVPLSPRDPSDAQSTELGEVHETKEQTVPCTPASSTKSPAKSWVTDKRKVVPAGPDSKNLVTKIKEISKQQDAEDAREERIFSKRSSAEMVAFLSKCSDTVDKLRSAINECATKSVTKTMRLEELHHGLEMAIQAKMKAEMIMEKWSLLQHLRDDAISTHETAVTILC